MTLVIRTRRPAALRFLDLALTAVGWLAFSYLVTAGLIELLNGTDRSLQFPLMGGVVSNTLALMLYATVAAINALLLMLWGTYRRRMTRIAPDGGLELDDSSLAERFALSNPQLQDIRLSRLLIIHHADDGKISHWESADSTAVRLSA